MNKVSEILVMWWPRDITDCTLLPDQTSLAFHDMRDVTDKEALVTDYYNC